MQLNPQRSDNAEVAPATPQRLEQLGLPEGICGHVLSVREHHLGAEHIVGRQTLRADERAVTAAQG